MFYGCQSKTSESSTPFSAELDTLSSVVPDTFLAYKDWQSVLDFEDREAYDTCMVILESILPKYLAFAQATNDISAWQSYLDKVNKIVEISLRTTQFEKADQYLTVGIQNTQNVFPDGHWKLARIYSQKGHFLNLKSKFKESIQSHDLAIDSLNHLTIPTIEQVKFYRRRGMAKTTAGQYESASEDLDKAKSLLATLRDEPEAEKGSLYNALGRLKMLQNNYYEALEDLALAKTYTVNAKGVQHSSLGTIYNNIGAVHFYLGNYDEALSQMEKSNEVQQQIFGYYHAGNYSYLNNVAAIANTMGDKDRAIKAMQKAFEIAQQIYGETHFKTGRSLSNLGALYVNNKDFYNAYQYNLKAKEIVQLSLGENHREVLRLNTIISSLLVKFNKFIESNSLIHSSLQKLKKHHPGNINLKTWMFRELSALHEKQGQYDSAKWYINKAIDATEAFYKGPHASLMDYYESLAKIYLLEDNSIKGLEALKKGIALKDQVPLNAFLPSLYSAISYVYQVRFDSTDLALNYQQENLKLIAPTFKPTSIFDNPDSTDIHVNNLTGVFKGLSLKSFYLKERYNETREEEYLQAALSSFKQTYKLYKEISTLNNWDENQLLLLEDIGTFFENGIYTAWKDYELNGNEASLNLCFEFIERGRANVLQQNLYFSEKINATKIPSELLEKERSLKGQIDGYQKLIFQEKSKKAKKDSAKIAIWEQTLLNCNQTLDSLKQILKKEYLSFYQLKYGIDIPAVTTIQSKLGAQQAGMLEINLSTNVYFVMGINKDSVNFHWTFAKDTLLPKINHFKKLLQDPSANPYFNTDKEVSYFAEKSHELYKELIEPVKGMLKDVNNIYIIANGPLNDFPFELLITEASQENSYRKLPYLQNKYLLQYDFSGALALEKKDKKASLYKTYAGFAPKFEEDKVFIVEDAQKLEGSLNEDTLFRGQFQTLKYNIPEVDTIKDLIGGVAFTGSASNLASFKKAVGQYKILHLATHALALDSLPNYSHLVLASDSLEHELLYAFEIGNLDFNNELIVLSACETGSGKYQQGEGVLSLARSFKYGGCENILTSLWKVEDRTTKDIMVRFYDYLQDGKGKAEALRLAKSSFLKEADQKYTHPFYWSTFIMIGDNAPISFAKSWPFWTGILLLGIIIFLLGRYIWSRRELAS